MALADMQSERMKKQEAYWLDVFSGEVPVLDMPTDYGRPVRGALKEDKSSLLSDRS
uniref:hypothetical protein n=1 Tax=Bacillus velezensis TaxID=492670 RepID=UPI0021751728